MSLKKNILVAALALASASVSWAHGIWFAQRSDRLALIYGDGAEDLDVVKRLPKVTAVSGLGADGKAVPVSLKPTDSLVFVDLSNQPVVITTTMDNGIWSRDAKGKWHGKGKDEVPDATISGRFFKYNTHLVKLPVAGMAPMPGLALQIVPVGPRFPQQMGEPLTVKVLFNGKPLPGAKVWQDMVTDPDGKPLIADAQGQIVLPVRNQGLNVVRAEHESAAMEPRKSLVTAHLATLSFTLEHAEE